MLNKQLDTISEQYETYKKIYELTGNKKGAQNIAFGGIVQFDTYKKFLESLPLSIGDVLTTRGGSSSYHPPSGFPILAHEVSVIHPVRNAARVTRKYFILLSIVCVHL